MFAYCHGDLFDHKYYIRYWSRIDWKYYDEYFEDYNDYIEFLRYLKKSKYNIVYLNDDEYVDCLIG